MRSWIAPLLMVAAVWQLSGGGTFDLAEATLAVAAAWFVTLFIAD